MKIAISRESQTTNSVEIIGPAVPIVFALALCGALLFWSITRSETGIRVVCPVQVREQVVVKKCGGNRGPSHRRIAQ
jgi:hypothetical protein